MELTSSPEQPEQLYFRRESALNSSAWWTVFGLAMLGVAVLGFALAIAGRPNQLTLHAMTTAPILLGLGALAAGRSFAATPKQIALGPQRMSIIGRRGAESYDWKQVGWATIATSALSYRKQLVIFDTQGKAIARISEAFHDFDELAENIQARIAAKAEQGDDTSERLRAKKGRRAALLTGGIGVLLLAVAGANIWMAYRQQRAAKLLAEAAVPGEAEIVRRFLAPNGVTARVEYRITNAQGRFAERNAEVTRDYWDSLEGEKMVPVLFVEGEPQISRLAAGEPPDDPTTSPGVMYVLSTVVAGISVLALAAAALQWNGWDIDLDSKTGKISIKRFGTGR